MLSRENIVYVVELEIAALKAKHQIALLCARTFLSFASSLFRYSWLITEQNALILLRTQNIFGAQKSILKFFALK